MLSPAETGPVLITGCSRGLGEASARLFQAAGYRTVATSRRGTDIEELRALGCDTPAVGRRRRGVALRGGRDRTAGPISRALTPDCMVDAHMTRQIPF